MGARLADDGPGVLATDDAAIQDEPEDEAAGEAEREGGFSHASSVPHEVRIGA
jgi:hypothetical protein